MAALTFHGDDSAGYHDDDPSLNPKVFVVAGYLTEKDEWHQITEEWLSVLHRKWPTELEEFKASDCENRQGAFKGWPKGQCDDLVKRLVDVVVNPKYSTLAGVSAAVVLSDFDPHSMNFIPEIRLRDGYLLAFGNVIDHAMSRLVQIDRDFVTFIFDDQSDVKGIAEKVFARIKRSVRSDLRNRMDGPYFRDSKISVPLQAADLLAYNTQKHVFNQQFYPRIGTRQALEVLTGNRLHLSRCFGKQLIDEVWRRVHEGEDLANLQLPEIYRSVVETERGR